jgi:putative membrane protein
VPARIETFFSDSDREAIRAATAAAERKTAGELVVYVTERCDPHPEVAWKAALIGGAVGALCAAVAVWRFGGWGAPDYLWMLIGLQVGVLVGWTASRFDGAARRLIDDDALRSRVDGRAAEAFLDEQVFATQDRTGVLIFVALFEHRVLVLADDGIDERVDAAAWDDISDELALAIRRGMPTQALIHAVERCADLLIEHGVGAPDSVNQLPDEPRFRRD